jgi:hypothetical protein
MLRLFGIAPLLLGWGAGLFLSFYPFFLSGGARVVGGEDSLLINYVLEHSYRWLLHHPLHGDLWSPPVFYPEPNTGAYTDVLLSAAPFYWCWRALGLLPDTAFQLWMLTVTSLNYLTAYLLLRRCLRLRSLAAAAGSFLFAFSSYRLGQIGHMQLHIHFYSVLSVYALYRLFELTPPVGATAKAPLPLRLSLLPARAWVGLFFAGVVCQLYASFYLGWFLGIALAAAAFWALLLPRCRERLLGVVRTYPLSLLLGSVLTALLLNDMARHYFQAARETGYRSHQEIVTYIPTLVSWVSQGKESWFSPANGLLAWGFGSQEPLAEGETAIGCGLITSLAVLLGFAGRRRQPSTQFLLLVALTLVAATTGVTTLNWSPWPVLYPWVPGAGAIRVIARVALPLLLPAAIGLGYFLQDSRRPAVALAVALLCVLEQAQTIGAFDKERHRRDVDQIARRVPPGCNAFFYAQSDSSEFFVKFQVDAMWAQLATNIPTVNAYLGKSPPGYESWAYQLYTPASAPAIEQGLRGWLQSHHVNSDAVPLIVRTAEAGEPGP